MPVLDAKLTTTVKTQSSPLPLTPLIELENGQTWWLILEE